MNGYEYYHHIIAELIDKGLANKYYKSGVYCIMIDDKIVYIGKSLNMLERIAQHLIEINRKNPKENKYKVLHQAHLEGYTIGFNVLYEQKYGTEEEKENKIREKEGYYIRQYKPVLNYQIPLEDWHHYKVNKKAQTTTLAEIVHS